MEKRAAGLVFIVEGNAERLYYESLVVSILVENGIIYTKKSENMNAIVSENLISTEYLDKKTYIYIKDCRSSSQLALQKDHIINIINKHFEAAKNFGIVFVCFDDETNKTRPYDEQDIDSMLADLAKEKIQCIKIKAENTIENFMFHSFSEIVKYLKLDKNTKIDNIKGKTGKSKMERLFNKAGKNYKTAGVVHGLISNLDMKKIIDKDPKLKEIEKIIKKQHGI